MFGPLPACVIWPQKYENPTSNTLSYQASGTAGKMLSARMGQRSSDSAPNCKFFPNCLPIFTLRCWACSLYVDHNRDILGSATYRPKTYIVLGQYIGQYVAIFDITGLWPAFGRQSLVQIPGGGH